jgi:hypothetical protein
VAVACLVSLFFDAEDGGSTFFQNSENFFIITQHFITGDGTLHLRDFLRQIMEVVHNTEIVQLSA